MWKLKVAEGSGPWLMTGNNHVGRQHWEFDPDAGTPEERAEVEALRRRFKANRFTVRQSSDSFMRMQMMKEKEPRKAIPEAVKVKNIENVTEEAVTTTLRRGVDYLCSIQGSDGHWPAELAGPLFLLPQLIMGLYITGGLNVVMSSEHQKEIKRYIYNHQNEDGGWGLHIEGASTVFGSTFNYVALRLLGEGFDSDTLSITRKWILDHGGALGIPSWGKFFLTILGIYEWEGCNPLPPELWLLPRLSPFPGKMTCYSRLIYLPMSYLYGKRFVGKITPLIEQLRHELYLQPYHEIQWKLARNAVSQVDIYYPPPLVQNILWGFLYNIGEPILRSWPFSKLREKALTVAMEHIHYEDINSNYLNTASITKVLCLISCWVEDPNSDAYKFHLARIPDFLWVAEDGMELTGTPGSQTWDATLAIQAILASNLVEEYGETLRKAHDFIKASQVLENPSGNYEKMYRMSNRGTWTFCAHDHGWQVSDCTADSLKTLMLFSQLPKELIGEEVETTRLYDAVDVLLKYQSKNGGISSWEPVRTYQWFEKFNPTEVFEDCIFEKEYVECTSAVIQSLILFKKLYPTHRRHEIESCIRKALEYIIDIQNPDGSWRGNWGICYTYGTWLAVAALAASGMTYNNSNAVRRGCDFLLSKQLPDGGWGESYLSYTNKVYTNKKRNESNLVQTSWSLLALIKGGQVGSDPTPVKKGVKLLINSQEENGDFPQQDSTGAFFNASVLHYTMYRNIFPTWALGEYRKCFSTIM